MKEQSDQSGISIIGMSWYYKDDFENVKNIFVDGANIGESYSDWLRKAEKGYKHFISKGHLVEKVFISSKYFPKWCQENNLELNSKARIRFSNEMIHKKYLENQLFDALCPIFLLNKFTDSLVQIGTGVLIVISDITFLLTVAHVIDEMKHGDILIPTGAGLKSLEGTYSYLETPHNKTRAEDAFDIGYFKLDDDFARSLHQDLNAIDIEDILL